MLMLSSLRAIRRLYGWFTNKCFFEAAELIGHISVEIVRLIVVCHIQVPHTLDPVSIRFLHNFRMVFTDLEVEALCREGDLVVEVILRRNLEDALGVGLIKGQLL